MHPRSIALTLLLMFTCPGIAHSRQQVFPVQEVRELPSDGDGRAKAAPQIIYSNTVFSNFFMRFGAGTEAIDFGVITGANDHDTVTDLTFGFATSNVTPGVDLGLKIYPGYTGRCSQLEPPALDMSITGLPGHPGTGFATGWILSLDLAGMGLCAYLGEGPFGYSFSFSDSEAGPILAAGGTGQCNCFDFTPPSSSCQTWWGGHVWYGFYTELGAHDGGDTFSGGCGGGLSLDLSGPTCSGSTVLLTIDGATAGDWWAYALGTSIGPGIGGRLGGCPLDLVPIVPIRVVGPLSSLPLQIPVAVNLPSATVLGMQVITKDPSTAVWDSSNTEILSVP